MIRIRFPHSDAKRQALGTLPGRFAFTSWSSGEMAVPEDALAFLAHQGIAFSIDEFDQSVTIVPYPIPKS